MPATTPSGAQLTAVSSANATGTDIRTVETRVQMRASVDAVWTTILFFEQIDERPPWYLRWLLPAPIGTQGEKSKVGDEALCHYEGGHLIKRVTHVEPGRVYRFEVTEQKLSFGRGMRLSGGEYRLTATEGGTDVVLVTRYGGGVRPRALFAPFEAAVCHAFHRHILRAMQRRSEGSGR